MTTYPPPPPPPASAQRPFWKKWWFWAAIVVVIIIIAVTTSGGGNDKSSTASDSSSSSTGPTTLTAAPSPGVSKGLGSSDASRDVTVSNLKIKEEFGSRSYSVDVTVKNGTSKRSNYVVTIALTSADGKEQLDTATVLAENLEPGQSKQDSGDFLQLSLGDKKVPSGAKVVLQEVQRTAA